MLEEDPQLAAVLLTLEQPVTSRPHPVTSQPEPTISQHEAPAAAAPSPVRSHPEPVESCPEAPAPSPVPAHIALQQQDRVTSPLQKAVELAPPIGVLLATLFYQFNR